MNERITALAIQAGMEHDYDIGGGRIDKDQIEQFAISIIRECSNLYFRHSVPGITREQDVDVGVAIRRHFGIV